MIFAHRSPTSRDIYSNRPKTHTACVYAVEHTTLLDAGLFFSIGQASCRPRRSSVQVPAKKRGHRAPYAITNGGKDDLEPEPAWPKHAGMVAHMSSVICFRTFRK